MYGKRIVCSLRGLYVAVFLSVTGAAATADESSPGIAIRQCVVYSQSTDLRVDCTDQAKRTCGDKSSCELPIGLGLSGGRDLDGDPGTWELVRVDYRCGAKDQVNGPHYQNDHATMTLMCRR